MKKSLAFATAFGLKEMPIPKDPLERWGDEMPLPAHVDYVKARIWYGAADPFRPAARPHAATLPAVSNR
jgi:hypothetical protein